MMLADRMKPVLATACSLALAVIAPVAAGQAAVVDVDTEEQPVIEREVDVDVDPMDGDATITERENLRMEEQTEVDIETLDPDSGDIDDLDVGATPDRVRERTTEVEDRIILTDPTRIEVEGDTQLKVDTGAEAPSGGKLDVKVVPKGELGVQPEVAEDSIAVVGEDSGGDQTTVIQGTADGDGMLIEDIEPGRNPRFVQKSVPGEEQATVISQDEGGQTAIVVQEDALGNQTVIVPGREGIDMGGPGEMKADDPNWRDGSYESEYFGAGYLDQPLADTGASAGKSGLYRGARRSSGAPDTGTFYDDDQLSRDRVQQEVGDFGD